MRILFLTRLFWPHVGGVEKHVEGLSLSLRKKKHRVTILTEKFDKNLKEAEFVNGVKIVRFSYPKIKYLGLFYIWFWLLANKNLIDDSDVIHIHDVFIWYLPFRFLYPAKPVYVTFHGYEHYPLRLHYKLIRKLSEILSWGNICIGSFIGKWYGVRPSFISYGAVDTNLFKPTETKPLYDAIYWGRLDEQSGFLNYLELIKRKKLKVLILGDGIYKERVAGLAEVRGFVKGPHKYISMGRYAFVSRYLAIMEAFAAKRLVFANYDNPLKRDYLKMTPFLKWMIIEKSPRKLAEKIEYYSKRQDKANELIESAHNWVKTQTWEKLAGQYIKLWGFKS